MKNLEQLLQRKKKIRVLGIDDAPFNKHQDARVNITGIICAGTRFEGMLWSQVDLDGCDATRVLITMIQQSKFYKQLHLVLLDGIAVAGFNIVDIEHLSQSLQLPVIAVMRRQPDLTAINKALMNFDDYSLRKSLIEKAGRIYESESFVFQVAGCNPAVVASLLAQLTDQGKVPEALRLAHLIASAVMTGESSHRA